MWALGLLNAVATSTQIEEGLKILARLISAYGEVYWPLFERLEKELEYQNSRQNRLKRYLPNLDQSYPVPPQRRTASENEKQTK